MGHMDVFKVHQGLKSPRKDTCYSKRAVSTKKWTYCGWLRNPIHHQFGMVETCWNPINNGILPINQLVIRILHPQYLVVFLTQGISVDSLCISVVYASKCTDFTTLSIITLRWRCNEAVLIFNAFLNHDWMIGPCCFRNCASGGMMIPIDTKNQDGLKHVETTYWSYWYQCTRRMCNKKQLRWVAMDAYPLVLMAMATEDPPMICPHKAPFTSGISQPTMFDNTGW